MRNSLEKMCETFIQNKDTIKNTFKLANPYLVSVCASDLCGKGVVVDSDKLKTCENIVDKKTSYFSKFRGYIKLPIVTKLAASDNPEQKFDDVLAIYEVLKKHFHETEYIALIATILTDMISVTDAEKYAERGKRIYNLMKKEHPFLTSSEDSVFAVLMAFSDKEDSELVADMEACYTTMKKQFPMGNTVQSLSHVLSMKEGAASEKCNHLTALYDELQHAGKKYGKSYESVVLASLSLLSSDITSMTEDILSVDAFLETQKEYSLWGFFDKRTRLMHAVMIVASDYSEEINTNTAAITGTIAMVAAQQAATYTALVAVTVASSSN